MIEVMNYSELAGALAKLTGPSVYICWQPEVLDFTDRSFVPQLKIFAKAKGEYEDKPTETSIDILLTDEILMILVPMLKLSICGKDQKIITWNWKNLVSFILGRTGKGFSVEGSIIDLKVIESYNDINMKAPASLSKAMIRLKDLISQDLWQNSQTIYKKLHLPLMTNVIPHLETSGILDTQEGKEVYAYYEIDGQENGRLKCSGQYKHSYVPHAMKPETRLALKPRSEDELFMVFDFKGQEVFVLAWMSKDPLLLDLCRERDIYIALFEIIMGKKCESKNDREIGKKMFLPVIYGQSAYALSQRCNIDLDLAKIIIERIYSLFPVALAFIEGYQKQLQEHGYIKDIFGKRRIKFEEGKEYSVRNFAVQSPASVVCLEKLSHLYFALKDKTDLAYTIHDGYAVYATKENWKTIYKIGREVLSGDSEFCPGLRLRVTCRAGRNLNDLKLLAHKED